MAEFPIVTDLTLSEIEALATAGTLEDGLQYNITDKGWRALATSDRTYKLLFVPTELTIAEAEALIGSFVVGSQYIITDWQPDTLLYADSVSTMKPMSGSVKIMNGEELPYVTVDEVKVYYVVPDTLLIDTGVVDWDTSIETGTPLSITMIDKYGFIGAWLIPIHYTEGSMAVSSFLGDNTLFQGDYETDAGLTYFCQSINVANLQGVPINGDCAIVVNPHGDNIPVWSSVLIFKRSPEIPYYEIPK